MAGRNPTAQYLRCDGDAALIDCGEGTQMRMLQFKCKPMKVSRVFISHLHGDHLYGLMGFLSTMGLHGRAEALTIYGPQGIRNYVQCSLNSTSQVLPFPITFYELDEGFSGQIAHTPYYKASCFPVKHSIACFGFVFETHQTRRRVNKAIVQRLGIPTDFLAQVADGAGWQALKGEVYSHERLTLPSLPARKYVYITDTRPLATFPGMAQRPTLLYHEATFLDAAAANAVATHHSTAKEAAEVAQRLEAERLIVGHFSARYRELDEHLAESQRYFPASELALEGTVFQV